MASFAFLPRSVKGKAKGSEPVAPSVTASTSKTPATVPAKANASRAPVAAEDVRALFSMALSSYSMLVEPAARRLLDRDEYIRLAACISVSPILAYLPSGISEAQIVSALRELPEDTRPDMRIGLHGYELHFKRKESLQHTHSAWEHRTVYVENMPVQTRTMASVHKAICDLLGTVNSVSPSTSTCNEPAIQHISFPPAQNSRDQQEVFRGFAFLVFKTEELAQQFLKQWPWAVPRGENTTLIQSARGDEEDEDDNHGSDDDDSESNETATLAKSNGHPDIVEQAKRSRFRALSKADWLNLKSEYLAEQRRLLELSRPQPAAAVTQSHKNGTAPTPSAQKPKPVDQPLKRPMIETPSYPMGCLVFARGLPAQTNKTALKAIFASAFGGDKLDGVDYVDWTKGMDMVLILPIAE
ncbi:hypothetical protein CALVIDRAFT_560864 [Calocera viscosa TUFC12733]|uniref:La-related protein 7 homolog xRRM domain-containing protein n=1 Tax=Calocera viscosa (strain TUFC12733) TaxID=1330018 RepID=A0A167QVD0_CALVF|nr:hypothetical protein CALVIDRAFT_560864 [Calocera viscosa TUFC12733]